MMPPPVDPAAHAAHAAHDTVLVAAFAAGDATGAELEAAAALVAACPDCAVLHRDLRAIAAALPAIPAPRRTRDFRLSADQAASLRPAGWRRLLVPFAGPRFAFAAPLGSGLAALGIVGVLLAGPGVPMGGPTAGDSGGESERMTSNGTELAPVPASPPLASPAASMEDTFSAQGASGDPDATAEPAAGVDPKVAPGPADQPPSVTGAGETVASRDVGSTGQVVLGISLVGLAAGLVMVALRFAARTMVRAP